MATFLITETEEIEIDATLSIAKQFSSRVTSFPVETGSNVSDNVSVKNRTFRLSGLISNATLVPLQSSALGIKGANDVFVEDNRRPKITFGNISVGIPGSINQFLPSPPPPKVTSGPLSDDRAFEFENILERIYKNKELLTISEDFAREHENLIMTTLSITRDKDNHQAVSFTASFEQLRFASSKTVLIDQEKETENKGAAETEDQGNKEGEEVDDSSPLSDTIDAVKEFFN